MRTRRRRVLAFAAATALAFADCAVERVDLHGKGSLPGPSWTASELAALEVRAPDLCATGRVTVRFDSRGQAYGLAVDLPGHSSIDVETGGDPVDTVLYLYSPEAGGRPAAVPAAVNDDAGPDGFSRIAGWTVPAQGRYLIVVTTWNGAGHGDVEVRIRTDGTAGCGSGPGLADAAGGDADGAVVPVPTCKPHLMPEVDNYGILAAGLSREHSISLLNAGTGTCRFRWAVVSDCHKECPTCSMVCPEPDLDTGPDPASPGSAWFVLHDTPAADTPVTGGAPMNLPFRVVGATPDGGFPGEAPVDRVGYLYVALSDESGNPMVARHALKAEIGLSTPVILPGSITFGPFWNGCRSAAIERDACLFNVGNIPRQVGEILLDSCPRSLRLLVLPPLPASLAPRDSMCVQVVYQTEPSVTAPACSLVYRDGDEELARIPIRVRMDENRTVHEQAVQSDGMPADVLFVVDDSSSMREYQQGLAAALGGLDPVAAWGSDFHVGLIDVNVLMPRVAGRLNRGDASRGFRYLTPAQADVGPTLQAWVAGLGCTGCPPSVPCGQYQTSDAAPSGLEAARLALSAPLTDDTGVACTASADCLADRSVCPDPAACDRDCLFDPALPGSPMGSCGGWNRGFGRDEAELHVVLLSDADDRSLASTAFYAAFLQGLKGPGRQGAVHFHPIVGTGADCADGTRLASAVRYLDVAKSLQAPVTPLCADRIDAAVKATALESPLRNRFPLRALPDAATITVEVAGAPCPQRPAGEPGSQPWTFDAASDSIVFDPGGSCMPRPGQTVRVAYAEACPWP